MDHMQEAQVQSVTYVPQKYKKEPLNTEFRVALGPAVHFLHPPKRKITNRILKHLTIILALCPVIAPTGQHTQWLLG